MGLFDFVKNVGQEVADLGTGIAEALENTAAHVVAPVVNVVDLGKDLLKWGEQALEQVGDWLDEIGFEKILASAHSPILLAGQATIANIRRTTGSGEPEDGAQFGTGAQRFTEAAQVLAGAGPTGDWTGRASGAYRTDNDRQREHATAMAHADQGVHQLLAKEAGQIKSSRGKLDDQSNWLADVGLTTLSMLLTPGVGLALKTAAELAAVRAAVKACQDEMNVLRGEVNANAGAIEALTANYQAVVDSPRGDLQGPGSVPPGGGGGASGTDGNGAGGNGSGPGGAGSGPGGAGSGGGASRGGGAPANVPTPAAPAVPMPKMPQAPAMSGTSSGLPAGAGGSPSAPGGGSPPASGGAAPTGLAEMVQAAIQRAMDQRDADEASDAKKARDDQKDSDGDGVPDAEEDSDDDGVPDAEDPDADGDGVPDAEEDSDGGGVPETVTVAKAGPDAAATGRAPVHVEIDVDPDRLNTPVTVTLDRDRPIVVTPATAT